MKVQTKIVMFGKKELVRCDEVEAISRFETTKTTRLFDGVLIGYVMCLFVEDKHRQKIEVPSTTSLVQRGRTEDAMERVQLQAPNDTSKCEPRMEMVFNPIISDVCLYSGLYPFFQVSKEFNNNMELDGTHGT